MGEVNMGQGLPLLQKRRDEFVQFFQGFRRLIDSGSGRRFDVLVRIVCEFCPVEEEIMGAGTQLRTAVADIRGLKKPGTEPGRKVRAVKGTAFAAALRTKGGAGSTSAQVLPGTGRKMSTFRASAAFLVMVVRNKEAVSADLFGDSRGIFGKSPCHLRKREALFNHDLNICTVRESKMFKVTSMMSCHNNLRSAPGITG